MSFDPPPPSSAPPATATQSPRLTPKSPKQVTKSPKLASANSVNYGNLKSPKLSSNASGTIGSPNLSPAISKRKSPKPSPLLSPKAPGASPRLPAASPRKKNPSPFRNLPPTNATAFQYQPQPNGSTDFPQSDSGIEVNTLNAFFNPKPLQIIFNAHPNRVQMGWMHQWLPSPHSGGANSHAAAPADAAAEDSWNTSMFSQLNAGASALPLQHTDDSYVRALLTQQQQQQRRHAHLEHSHALFPPPFSATTPTDMFSRPNTSPLHLLDDQLLQVRAPGAFDLRFIQKIFPFCSFDFR